MALHFDRKDYSYSVKLVQSDNAKFSVRTESGKQFFMKIPPQLLESIQIVVEDCLGAKMDCWELEMKKLEEQ